MVRWMDSRMVGWMARWMVAQKMDGFLYWLVLDTGFFSLTFMLIDSVMYRTSTYTAVLHFCPNFAQVSIGAPHCGCFSGLRVC